MRQGLQRSDSNEVETIFESILAHLQRQFPICMSSDEFHYFPQARVPEPDWSRWDDFSDTAFQDLVSQSRVWEKSLDSLDQDHLPLQDAMDIRMIRRVMKTLVEQLTLVCVHKTQPTFYLTLVGIGLSEAIEKDHGALCARLERLPEFFNQACLNLLTVPRLFAKRGYKMIHNLQSWLGSLGVDDLLVKPVAEALENFLTHIKGIPKTDEFLISQDLYEHIAFHHMGCNLSIEAISDQLDEEIDQTRSLLEKYAARISPSSSWQTVIKGLPSPACSDGTLIANYTGIIQQLAEHCFQKGIITRDFMERYPVKVEPVPGFMHQVRSNAAYSMKPCYPPQGGTFYIHETLMKTKVLRDYQILSAHETYPGHHLLDTYRWNHERLVRRHIEFPVFYEGWASFSEELCFDTGFFFSLEDQILMAQRRFWRAMRGRIDLSIHMRRQTLKEAADFMTASGMDEITAKNMVNRYVLKPGYQLSYTIGRRYFADIYDAFKKDQKDPVKFMIQVLESGQIGFDDLKKLVL